MASAVRRGARGAAFGHTDLDARRRGCRRRRGPCTWAGDGRAFEGRRAWARGCLGASAAGLLWSVTFVVGWLVDWGRYGTDLGVQILAALAGLLVLAQLTFAAAARGLGRPIAWLGALVALPGGSLLGAAVAAAIVLEPPLAIRLPLSPSAIWDRAMLLVMVGSGVSAMAYAASRRSRGEIVGAVVVVIAAAALAVALFIPFEADRIIGMTSESGEEGGDFVQLLAPAGWFVTTPLVVAAGIVFGVGWAWIGRARLREVGRTAGPAAELASDIVTS